MYQKWEGKRSTPVLVALDGKLTGLLAFADRIRKDAYGLIKKLQEDQSINVLLITGDNTYKAFNAGERLGINNVYSQCNNEDKVKIVRDYKNHGTLMMVGDGVNDLGAMGEADASVSFANSAWDRIKINSDYIIMDDEMLRIADTIFLSRESHRLINQSITISQLYNFFFGVLAFMGSFDAFAAKGFNTINSLMVLLLNKRIEYVRPHRVNHPQLTSKI